MLPSRAIRRSPKYMQSAGAARSSFSQISSSRRRVTRKKKLEAELAQARSISAGSDLSPTSSAAALAEDSMRKTLANIESMAHKAENQGGEGVLRNALHAMLDGFRQMQQ